MAGKRLAAAVHVHHPDTGEKLLLLPGDQVPPEVADLITHPDAFHPEDDEEDESSEGDEEEDQDAAGGPPLAAPAARARKTRASTAE
ncbi:hypothetical protein AB0D10_00830 [Kitasatospora sp. NPDC048545]|uniref:hypothetical protein n=1 Tax=Kitasatospora sp. NPDC048545 TaxID=3157208 RepID=UPI0033D02980